MKKNYPYALMIANGASCKLDLLKDMFSEAAFVLALDGALNRLINAGFVPDAVLGDLDSVQNLDKIHKKYPNINILKKPDQEKTDFEKGLDYLIESGFPNVDILWATGARADHTFANFSNLVKYSHRMAVRMMDDQLTIFDLPKDFTGHFKAGTVISLMPVGKVEGISATNLRYPLQNENLEIGGRIGTSNEVLYDGTIHIQFSKGHLLMGIMTN